MKQIGILSILLLALALSACEKSSHGKENSYLVAQPKRDGGYELVMLELETLSDPLVLSSHVARIKDDTYLGQRHSDLPDFRLRAYRGDQGWLPLDVTSGQAITIYSYLEKIWKWERSQGIPAEWVWPVTVVLNARVAENGQKITNNAFYQWTHNAIWIAPYTSSNTPHSLNIGVIAHEFAHARFTNTMMRLLMSGENEDINGIDLTMWFGWNEGLADYFGYVMSSQAEFMRDSFDVRHAKDRSLFHEPSDWMDRAQFESCVKCTLPGCKGSTSIPGVDGVQMYRLGTEYARRLYQWGEAVGGGDQHGEIFRILMTHLQSDLKKIYQSREPLNPDTYWKIIEGHLVTRFGQEPMLNLIRGQRLQCVP